jgi:uncharacterized protein YjbI with pentapeptide repeats
MIRGGWIRRPRTVATALGLALVVAIVAFGIFGFGWDWKAVVGWKPLVDYINPKYATGRKDAIQVYAVIVAGGVAAITAAVGLLNLRLTRKNLEQQRELEAQRAQGTALQAYYEQIGKLIADKELLSTDRKEIRELARGQTLTVLQEVDAKGKGSLLTFLHAAGLIDASNPAVVLTGADLRGAHLPAKADLRRAHLIEANLQDAHLPIADLQDADLQGANLQEAMFQTADLRGAHLQGADLRGADLRGADLQEGDLEGAHLQGAIMPDGSKHP